MSVRLVYLCGPMRGHPLFNFPAFTDAAAALRAAGYEVLSPHERDLALGFDPARPIEEQGFDLVDALRWDVAAVLRADATVVLPGWETSRGARAEVAVAKAADKPVLSLAAALTEWGVA